MKTMTHLYKIAGQDGLYYRTQRQLLDALPSMQNAGSLAGAEVHVYDGDSTGEPTVTLDAKAVLMASGVKARWLE